MVYIESEDSGLYRGYGRGSPVEVWSPSKREFRPLPPGTTKPEGWGRVIDEARARELMGAD
jgi:hypothetical protein